jgi:ATP-binding cassette subfamily F protein uup
LPPIISAQGLSKKYGSTPLFRDISFTVSSGDCIGVIGPNGSGKSTLLEILAGRVRPDTGDVAVRKGTRLSCVSQMSEFAAGDTVLAVVEKAMEAGKVPHSERAGRVAETLGRVGFTERGVMAATLSGGWRKRLAVAEALVQKPDVLLLDEPTNHLDLAGIAWLEALLRNPPFACVVVSHDRYFLENVATEVVELNKLFADGLLRVDGNYSTFLEAKELYLHAQRKEQAALANRVHTEIEWLRRGPKARTTKSKSRIGKAHEMIGELADLNARTRSTTAKIDFSATNRQTKQLITLDGVSCELGGRKLFKDLNFSVTAGMRVGLVGPNGSGKTTLLRLLRGEMAPDTGKIQRAEPLRIVYFDQSRQLDPDLILRRALAPDSDAVIYQDQVIHVAAWAARFLFAAEDLNQRVGKLSGGERARVLIAQLMLQPADVLLLDEPTNDLDIPTLEILEESLLEFRGALVLVTHDRYMLDRVSTVVLGLDGAGGAERFADYSQWDAWQRQTGARSKNADANRRGSVKANGNGARARVANRVTIAAKTTAPSELASKPALSTATSSATKQKLSYQEGREFANIEESIAQAEATLSAKHSALTDPEVVADGQKLLEACAQVEEAQNNVERLYARWAELAEKKE